MEALEQPQLRSSLSKVGGQRRPDAMLHLRGGSAVTLRCPGLYREPPTGLGLFVFRFPFFVLHNRSRHEPPDERARNGAGRDSEAGIPIC